MSDISTQTHPLLTAAIIELLNRKNIINIYHYIGADHEFLCKITKFTLKNVLLIKKHILRTNSAVACNAYDYYTHMLQRTAIISSNYNELDALLNGGFYTGNIYELCARKRTPTYKFTYEFIAHFASKHANQKLLFVDTFANFNPLFLESVIKTNKKNIRDTKQAMDNVFVYRALSTHQLIDALYMLKHNLQNRVFKLRLVLISSLPPLLYEAATLEKHNLLLNTLINVMRLLMVEYHVCFLVDNVLNVVHVDDGKGNVTESEKVAGGKYWQTLPNVRLKFEPQASPRSYEVTVLKNNQGPINNKCIITL